MTGGGMLVSMLAVLLAFGLGWLFREVQLQMKRAKMRRKRAANQRRKARGVPKVGVTGSRTVRKPRINTQQTEYPWAAPAPKAGYKLSMKASDWLEDTYVEPEPSQPDYNVIDLDKVEDQVALWRGKKPGPGRKLNDHEIMASLLADDDGAQEK